jgi:hypothetical protein
LTSEYEERLRLLDIANGYRASALTALDRLVAAGKSGRQTASRCAAYRLPSTAR